MRTISNIWFYNNSIKIILYKNLIAFEIKKITSSTKTFAKQINDIFRTDEKNRQE